MTKKLISILTPVYNEESNIRDCFNKVKKFFQRKKKYNYEHIFVDNNSFDASKKILEIIATQNKHVKVLFNKENYEVLPSIYNALKFAKGDGVLICYSADGQDPIETLDVYLNYYERGYDVISAQRVLRDENKFWFFLKFVYYFNYIFFNKYFNIREKKHFFVNVFQLVNKDVLKKILKFDCDYPHLPSLCYINGKKIKSINSRWIKRKKGKSYNNFANYLIEAVFCYFCFTNFFEFLTLTLSIISLAAGFFYNEYFYFISIPFLIFYIFVKIYLISVFSNKKFIINKKLNI